MKKATVHEYWRERRFETPCHHTEYVPLPDDMFKIPDLEKETLPPRNCREQPLSTQSVEPKEVTTKDQKKQPEEEKVNMKDNSVLTSTPEDRISEEVTC